METDTEETVPGESYLLVSNIPSDFHTSDLREKSSRNLRLGGLGGWFSDDCAQII